MPDPGQVSIDLTRPVHVSLAELPERWVPVADFAMSLTLYKPDRTTERLLAVWDASTSELVRLPVDMGERRSGLEFFGLVLGGRKVLLEGKRKRRPRGQRLCLMDIGTGSERWFATDPATYGAGVRGSVSPDGGTIATVLVAYHPDDPRGESETMSIAVVSLIDVATGETRRLFAAGLDGAGGWGGSSGTAWSPDQQHLAATYLVVDDEHPDGDFMTVVLDLHGDVVMPSRMAWLEPNENAAWLDEQTLLCADENGEVAPVNVFTGEAGSPFAARSPLARLGNRFVYQNHQRAPEDVPPGEAPIDRAGNTRRLASAPTVTRLSSVQLDGQDDAAWLRIDAHVGVDKLEFSSRLSITDM